MFGSTGARGYYFRPDDIGPDPIRLVLKAFCGGKEPPEFVKGYTCGKLDDVEHEKLIEWLLGNALIYWTIGIALVEAADTLVSEAVGNANIPPAEYWEERRKEEAEAVARPARKRRKR